MFSKILSQIVLSGLWIWTGQLLASTTSELCKQAFQFHHGCRLKQVQQLYQQVLNQLESATPKKPALMAESLTDLVQVVSFLGSGQGMLSHRFCDYFLDTIWNR